MKISVIFGGLAAIALIIAMGWAMATNLSLTPIQSGRSNHISLFPSGNESIPTEWEHGWKTDRVVATRYKNPNVGYFIGFNFPKNPNDCDRAELSDFMASKGGGVLQSGGYPGAEMMVVFIGVTDKETANTKIQAVLPELSQFITDLGNGKKVTIKKASSQ